MWGSGAAGEAGVPEEWVEVMGWEDASWWTFDAEGRARNVMAELGGELPRGGGGCAEGEGRLERVVDGRGVPGVAWVEGTNAATVERGEVGDVFLPAGRDAEGELYLTDAGSEVRRLKRWRRDGGKIETVEIGGGDFELVAPISRSGMDGRTEVLGGTSMTVEGYRNVYLDEGMRRMEEALREAFPGAMAVWREAAPEGGRWIVECAFRDRPATTVEAEPEAGTWRVLSEYGGRLRATRREVVRWRASDGAEATGVLTWAEGAEGALPLAVFPHGGPGTCSTVAFDPRVYMLADAGFAVFQPNYRGSTGAGKAFRVGGWGVEGLRRAMLDIREGVEAVRGDGRVALREGKAFLLGGSWGGYCVLAQAAFWPEEYAAAAAFFGASDLPALVEEEREMHGEQAALEVAVQLGLDGSGEALEALRGLSPVEAAGRIGAPVRIWHNRGDRTVAFGQSERFAAAMRAAGKACEFRAGEGGHGFGGAREEAAVYWEICGWWEGVLRRR